MCHVPADVAPGVAGAHNLGCLSQHVWLWTVPGIARQAAWETWLWWEEAGTWAPFSFCSLSWLSWRLYFSTRKIFPYFLSTHVLDYAKWNLFSLTSILISYSFISSNVYQPFCPEIKANKERNFSSLLKAVNYAQATLPLVVIYKWEVKRMKKTLKWT